MFNADYRLWSRLFFALISRQPTGLAYQQQPTFAFKSNKRGLNSSSGPVIDAWWLNKSGVLWWEVIGFKPGAEPLLPLRQRRKAVRDTEAALADMKDLRKEMRQLKSKLSCRS